MKQEREQKTDVQIAHQNHQKIEDAAMAKFKPVLSDAQYKKYQGIVEAEAYARHHRAAAAAPRAWPLTKSVQLAQLVAPGLAQQIAALFVPRAEHDALHRSAVEGGRVYARADGCGRG